ncbi:hypothetical protein Tco_0546470 [Tanacetum coccineum]
MSRFTWSLCHRGGCASRRSSHTAVYNPLPDSSGYITESDPEEDPKEDDEDPEEDPADYPTDRDDDDDEDEEESSGDDADNEEQDEDEDKRRRRAAVPSTYILAPRLETPPSGTPPLLLILLPTTSPPLLLPSTNYRADVPEVTLPPRNRLCIAPGPRYEVGESSFAPTARPTGGFRADYGFVGTLDAEIRRDPDREIGYGLLIFGRIQMRLQRRYQRLMWQSWASSARMTRLMEAEARASREAWVQFMDASDTTPSEMAANTESAATARIHHIPVCAEGGPVVVIRSGYVVAIKMAPKRTTRSSPTTTTTTTTTVTDAQVKALIDQGIADALAARDADRSRNGEITMILEWV